MVNYGWEYVWHCHLLGHEENDMMRSQSVAVAPKYPPADLTATWTGPKINLAWKDTTVSETNWTIQRAATAAGPWTDIARIPSTTGPQKDGMVQYSDGTAVVHTPYVYQVLATNIVGDTTVYSSSTGPTGYPTVTVNSAPSNTAVPTIVQTSIELKIPNGGESWQRGTSQTITWSYTGSPGSNVKIVLLKHGIQVSTIASSVSIGSGGQGSYAWSIPASTMTGSDYKVTVQSVSQPTVKDTSDNYFTIAPAAPATIKVKAPNGGESWQRGTSQTITWSYTGSPGSNVKIVLLKHGIQVSTIASSVSTGSGGQGSYAWSIPASTTTGSDYKVTVQSVSQPTVKDTSDNYFTIAPAAPATITVKAPNGGESWQRGTSRTITWSYTGSPGSNVKIELLRFGVPVRTIASSVSIGSGGQGSYAWSVPSSVVPGNYFKVSVRSVNLPAIRDTSNNYFRITL